MLSFASLSVRPGLYVLFEQHIVSLPRDALRPALKSIILGLLPAIEEETSEDFERAIAILVALERKALREGPYDDSHDRDGYFWQCLFLGVITSPSRRQGALNYLVRRLPSFTASAVNNLSSGDDTTSSCARTLTLEAESVILPEPGLLLRCFVSGLCDPQMLIQRGFLDLLVSHLPLHSPLLQEKVEQHDMDLLVSAAIGVLTRRDMSLNRRLWSWFLGPDQKDVAQANPPSSPHLERRGSDNPSLPSQLDYFSKNGQGSLERCILEMLRKQCTSAVDVARPFRICLSLMDRWEIGGSLVPRTFLPAMKSAFEFCTTATASEVSDVFRSVSLFFDGVEANLIWTNLTQLLAIDNIQSIPGNLALFVWIVERFNVRDEEMLTTHIPISLLYLLSLLQDPGRFPEGTWSIALRLAALLAEVLPPRVFGRVGDSVGPASTKSPDQAFASTSEEIRLAVIRFYDAEEPTDRRNRLPIEYPGFANTLFAQLSALAQLTLRKLESDNFPYVVPLLLNILPKLPRASPDDASTLFGVMHEATTVASSKGVQIRFPVVSALIGLTGALYSNGWLARTQLLHLEPNLTACIWDHLSPYTPKYQIEAVKSLWQLESLVASGDIVQISLLGLLYSSGSTLGQPRHISDEAARRFAVLWSHTLPAQSVGRRGSNMSNSSDVEQIARQRHILKKPLLLILDTLDNTMNPGFDAVRLWLSELPSLEQVFTILLSQLDHFLKALGPKPDSRTQVRDERNRIAELEYVLDHLGNVLIHGNGWTWQSLRDAHNPQSQTEEPQDGLFLLARACTSLLEGPTQTSKTLDAQVLRILGTLITGPAASNLRPLELDSLLMNRLIRSLTGNEDIAQVTLLPLITNAIRLRLNSRKPDDVDDGRPRSSLGVKRPSSKADSSDGTFITSSVAAAPASQILRCLCVGFSSPAARRHMDQWLIFLADVLPTFGDTIISNLIPMVECFCSELEKEFASLLASSSLKADSASFTPEAAIMYLLEGLEMILARANDSLVSEPEPEGTKKQSGQSVTFLGNVASGMFKADGPPSRPTQSNSRLTVTLAFQDAIRTSLELWIWATHGADADTTDRSCAATTAYSAMRVRNKTRQLLDHIFLVEPLEGLEVLIAEWCHPSNCKDAAATMNLLHIMQGSRPKNVVPAILDALCSRANISTLPLQRQSSLTIDLNASDVALFYSAYLESIEDDAMDEVWQDCINFLRDVIANPLPYRQILSTLLWIVQLLAKKVGNTNFGEQKRMRRDLGDVFQRLLTATFTTLPGGLITEPVENELPTTANGSPKSESDRRPPTDLFVVLSRAVTSLDIILESPDRAVATINTISASLINPLFHAKSFPKNVSLGALTLVLEMAKKVPTAKSWKKDLTDAFNDPRLLASSQPLMVNGWFPALRQWSLRDKERLSELLSRMTAPSSAGIMFGVGANAARLDADRKTQLNLRRVCIVLLSAPEDAFVANIAEIQEKIVELFEASLSSSPSNVVKAELFMLCRAVLLAHSSIHLSSLWPIINDKLQAALASLLPNSPDGGMYTNLSLLQACKLLDQLVIQSPDDFQIYEWLYITDTVDAVYQPGDWTSSALTDNVSNALASSGTADEGATMFPMPTNSKTGKRRPVLGNNLVMDKEDLRALPREEFTRAVLKPFLSQLSILAYEGVYSMDGPDLEACRSNLLEDVLDQSTIVE